MNDDQATHKRTDKTNYPMTEIQPNAATCPDCGGRLKRRIYTVKERDIKTRVITDQWEGNYLQCCHCGRKYDPMSKSLVKGE